MAIQYILELLFIVVIANEKQSNPNDKISL